MSRARNRSSRLRHLRATRVLPLLLALALPRLLRAQADVPHRWAYRGIVRSAETGAPVAFAPVDVFDRRYGRWPNLAMGFSIVYHQHTDLDGRFEFSAERGPRFVYVRACMGAPPVPLVVQPDTSLVRAAEVRVETVTCAPAPPEEEFRGHFWWGFEAQNFVRCGDEQPYRGDGIIPDWGVAFARGMLDTLRFPPGPLPYYVRWRGVPSPVRRQDGYPFGATYLGIFARLLIVTRVLEVRLSAPGDCG